MRDPVGIVVYSFASSFGVANITMQLIIGGIGVAFLAMGFHKKNGTYISEFSAIILSLIEILASMTQLDIIIES